MTATVIEREVEVGGRPTRYLAGGEGPPLVLLHGTSTNGREWAWSLPALARGRSVYAPDMPGFDGGGPVADPSPEHYAASVAAFLDTLGLGPTAVVGNSFGGLVALRLALSEPSRVPALALVDSAGLGREVSPALVAPTAPGLGELTLRWGQTPAGAAQRAYSRAPLLFANSGRVPPEWYEEQYRAAQTPGFMETTFATLRAHFGPFGQLEVLLGELPRLQMPALVVWGSLDLIFPTTHARDAAARLRRGKLAIIPGCGHLPHVECPEEFASVLGPFLDEHGPTRDGARRP